MPEVYIQLLRLLTGLLSYILSLVKKIVGTRPRFNHSNVFGSGSFLRVNHDARLCTAKLGVTPAILQWWHYLHPSTCLPSHCMALLDLGCLEVLDAGALVLNAHVQIVERTKCLMLNAGCERPC